MKTDWERLFECLTCENDPMTCNCTDADEDEERSCTKWKERKYDGRVKSES